MRGIIRRSAASALLLLAGLAGCAPSPPQTAHTDPFYLGPAPGAATTTGTPPTSRGFGSAPGLGDASRAGQSETRPYGGNPLGGAPSGGSMSFGAGGD